MGGPTLMRGIAMRVHTLALFFSYKKDNFHVSVFLDYIKNYKKKKHKF